MSWRILLEDLQTACEQLKRGEALKLPRKTTSYKQWAERLALYADSDSLSKEAAYWLDERRRQVRRLPTDRQTGSNSVSSTRKVFASLDAQETRALLEEVPAAYRTEVNDALLTALAQTFARWSGERRLLVNVEAHGREEVVEDVNPSRTVGCFTTIFPVLLELGETWDVGEVLKSVKEQLHAVPQHGIGYGLLRYLREDALSAKLRGLPPAEVLFNYPGQLDSVLAGSKLLRAAHELSVGAQSEKEMRRHVLEINADISDGRLRMTWSYSENLHGRATIERLAAEHLNALREVIKHCQSPEASGLTPADFPEARLSQKELDKILGKFKPRG
jgi:non-ribosomal peptide synthase protein (TIGR01720 family)